MSESEARLGSIPWSALKGIEPLFEAPFAEVLGGAAAERVLDHFLRAHREFTAEQRQASAEAIFGVGLWRRRLRGDLLQSLIALPDSEPPSSWRERYSFPDWIGDRFDARFGAGAPALADALNRPGPVTLRARGSRDELAARLRDAGVETVPGVLARQALRVVTPRPNLLGLGPGFAGAFEVQDEGSQLLGELLDVQPGDEVLDLCAGAGGKSLQLAALGATVHATDIDLSKLDRLRTRAAKANARVLIHGAKPPAGLRVKKLLIDAPCSELGALRRGPDLRWRIREEAVHENARVQRELIALALRHLAPGGTLVYATCTLTPEENEDVVAHALATHAELTLMKSLELTPHRHGTDGFYAAVFSAS